MWWCHLELNQGHTDFQSVALPTELWHLVFERVAKVIKFSILLQLVQNKLWNIF